MEGSTVVDGIDRPCPQADTGSVHRDIPPPAVGGAWDGLKTSYRVVGAAKVDEFAGVCAALGLRPHQLVARLVDEGIARYRQDLDVDTVVSLICEGRRRTRVGAPHDEVADGAQVIDARDRFGGSSDDHPCRECGRHGTTLVLPHVDHRRKKPWPEPHWLCSQHSTGEPATCARVASDTGGRAGQDNEPDA